MGRNLYTLFKQACRSSPNFKIRSAGLFVLYPSQRASAAAFHRATGQVDLCFVAQLQTYRLQPGESAYKLKTGERLFLIHLPATSPSINAPSPHYSFAAKLRPRSVLNWGLCAYDDSLPTITAEYHRAQDSTERTESLWKIGHLFEGRSGSIRRRRGEL